MDQVNVPEDVARVEWMVMSGFPDCMSLIVTVLPTLPVVVHVRVHDCPAVHCVGAVAVMEGSGPGSDNVNLPEVVYDTPPVVTSRIRNQ